MTVRFIRAEDMEGDGKNDDRAVITGLDDDVYQLAYHFGDCKKKQIVKEALLDQKGVVCWFNRVLHFVDADYAPFAGYQFDFPLMPSVLIAHQELHHHHPTILAAVKFHLENWCNENDFDYVPDACDVPHPDDFMPFNPDEDNYDSSNVNNVTHYDFVEQESVSSLAEEEYASHTFYDESGKEKKKSKKNKKKSKHNTA
jgi:hypothetical protein